MFFFFCVKKMEKDNDDRILVQVRTRPLSIADIRRIVLREVKTVLTFYLHNNIISHEQFDEIKRRSCRFLINTFKTNKSEIIDTVKDYVIQVLARDRNSYPRRINREYFV